MEVLESESDLSLMVSRGILWPRAALGSQFVEVLEAQSAFTLMESEGVLWPRAA